LLSVADASAVPELVRSVERLADADLALLVSPLPDSPKLTVIAAAGFAAERLVDATIPLHGTITETVLASGEPVLVDNAAAREVEGPYVPRVLSLGPAMLLPLAGQHKVRGVLIASRKQGRRQFTEADLEMGTTFATHASLALELVEARLDQQRMTLMEDRTRIARDLHDHVIQQLFAAGMTVQGVATGLADDARTKMLDKVVDTLDDAIKQIRTSIFQLRPHNHTSTSLRSLVLALVAEIVPALGFEPRVSFEGPVDAVSDDDLAADVLAVIREALSNTAKHAEAHSAAVRVEASTTELRVTVEDDGIGMGPTTRRSGLANLRQRAEQRGGDLSISPGSDSQGSSVTCSLPLG
jgi:signal transduction histidine kinase